jgi:UDP-2,3-diacylglucosamine pyrophosphatase LpxH
MSYYDKYLKYKNKYLQLQMEINGGKLNLKSNSKVNSKVNSSVSNNFIVISDMEGIKLDSYLPENFDGYIYVCGDLLDSTTSSTTPIDFTKNDFADFLKYKSNNIYNIMKASLDPKVKYIFGNRDLNKVKCRNLCKLKEDPNNLVYQFNNGNIELDNRTYNKLKDYLLGKKLNQRELWNIKSNNAWYPFWNGRIATEAPGVNVGDLPTKDWGKPDKIDKQVENKPFLMRFYDIFGPENTSTLDGSMNAKNILYAIPSELGYITNNNIDVNNEDYYAFIVLAIYRSMLLTNNSVIKMIKNFDEINNSNQVKGILINLFKKGEASMVVEDNNNVFLLSHGGIPLSVLSQFEKLNFDKGINSDLYNYLVDASLLWENRNNNNKPSERDSQIKGDNVITLDYLKNQISKLNNIFKESIKDVVNSNDNDVKPSKGLLLLLMMTAPFNCLQFLDKIDSSKLKIANRQLGGDDNEIIKIKNEMCNLFGINQFNSDFVTPVMSGLGQVRLGYFVLQDSSKTLYQIFGHKSYGYAITIDKQIEKDQNSVVRTTILMNLDIVNTFNASLYANFIKPNKVFMQYKNGKINTYSNILLNEDYIKKETTRNILKVNEYQQNNTSKLNDSISKDKETNKFFDQIIYSNGVNLYDSFYINNDLNNIQILTDLDRVREINYNSKVNSIYYHGRLNNNYVFSVHSNNGSVFAKNLYILNEADFTNFTSK